MRWALLAMLAALPASAQRIWISPPPAPSVCSVDSTVPLFAAYYRATTTTGTAFQCDSVLASCMDLGPGARDYIGTNVSGEVVLGPASGNSTVLRIFGTIYAVDISSVNVTSSNVVSYAAALDQGNTAFMRNTNANKPVKVDDAEGLQITCKSSLPTCGTVPEGTVLTICGAAGARTKKCECTSDGTNFAWFNSYNPSAGAGTTTTCPAT